MALALSGRVTVAVPDATRPLDPAHVERLVADLERRGAEVTLLVALGLHRPMTAAEIGPLSAIAASHGVMLLQHDAGDPDGLLEVGDARFHRAVVEADHTVCVGLVEPHQYAGFSGGVKTVAVGCAGRETIDRLHGLRLLREPGTRLGRIEGNPFQAELVRLTCPLDLWALQVVPGGGVHEGPALEAHAAAVEEARQTCFEPLPDELDWMHLVVPPSKAQSFYQASRAATYVALSERPAIRQGGRLVLEASCPEGLGQGAGERAFAEALRRGREALLSELAADRPIRGGEQRAYVLAMALERAEIVLVGPELEGLEGLIPRYASAADAVAELSDHGRRFDDPFHRVPILEEYP